MSLFKTVSHLLTDPQVFSPTLSEKAIDKKMKALVRQELMGNEQSLSYRELSQRQINCPGPLTKVPHSIEKTRSLKSSLFSCFVTYPIEAVAKFGLKALRYGVLKLGSDRETKLRNDQLVCSLTGSPRLILAIHELSPWLAQVIQEKMLSFGLSDILSEFLKSEMRTLQDVIRLMLPKIFINIADYRGHIKIKDGNSSARFNLLDAIACLVEVFESHLPKIRDKIHAIEEIPDLEKRTRKLRQLFVPLSAELLTVILPKKEKEFPIINLRFISRHYWSQFKNQIFPHLLLKLYQQLDAPFHLENRQKLLQLKGGSTLAGIADEAALKAGELMPALSIDFQKMSQGLNGLLTGSDELKNYLSTWMTSQIDELMKCEQAEIKILWKLFGSYLGPLLQHIFLHMAETSSVSTRSGKNKPDATGVIAIKLCVICSHFFNAHQEAIENRIAKIAGKENQLEKDTVLLQLFNLLAKDLLVVMGLDHQELLPIPEFLKDAAMFQLKNFVPKLLLRQYLALKNCSSKTEACGKQFRTLFFDPKNLSDPSIATSVVSRFYQTNETKPENMFNEFHQDLWDKSGTEYFVQSLEKMLSVFSGNVIEELMKRYGISKQRMLGVDSNPFMKKLTVFLKSSLEATLLKTFVHIIESTPEDPHSRSGVHPKLFIILRLFRRFSDIFGRGLKNIEEKLQEIEVNFAHDPALREQEGRKIFSSLSKELHAAAGVNPLDHLPWDFFIGADAINNMLWEIVKSAILPEILSKNYASLVAWHLQKQQHLNLLEDCYHTTHAKWTCHVLAQYASDFVRHYLVVSHDEAAKLLVEALQNYFRDGKDFRGKEVAKILYEKSAFVETALSQNIHAIGKSQDSQILLIGPVLTKYIEAALAKCFANISVLIRDIETNQPDFMVDAAINMLKATAEYFQILNEQADKHSEEHVYRIDPKLMIAAFGSRLHEGVPLDPFSSDEIKDKHRLDGWLIPMASKLMKLANLSIEDLPLPSSIRRTLGELISMVVLPRVLLAIDKKMLEPCLRDILMLNSIQMLYAALNDIKTSSPEEIPDNEKSQDPKTKSLNELCGAIVLEIVKLIPDTMAQYVFMKEKVKNLSAEAIGGAIMAYLSKWTLLQVIDTIIYQALPSLHPARWEGKVGREVLIPRKTIVKPLENVILNPVKKFKFTFPETFYEINEEHEKQLIKAKEIRQDLRNAFSKTISSQLFAKSWGFIKSMWVSFQSQLDDFIAFHLPEHGPYVKMVLDRIFQKIFFVYLGPIIQFLGYPFFLLAISLSKKLQIDRKSDDIIENLHSVTVEHLLYKWTDIIIDTLIQHQQKCAAGNQSYIPNNNNHHRGSENTEKV